MSTKPEPRPQRVGSTPLAEGRWLRLDRIDYVDAHGRERSWESAGRQQSRGAVFMIPRLRPSDRYAFIQQYRPPQDRFILEFPAGLIDDDEPPEQTAVRELYEETGYHGTVQWIGAPACSSPGMSAESVILTLMDIDETLPGNQHPEQATDEGEDIEVLLVKRENVPTFLRERKEAGVLLDSRLVAFFLGQDMTW